MNHSFFLYQIQTMIKRCQSEQGMGFTEIKQKLRGVSDSQIRYAGPITTCVFTVWAELFSYLKIWENQALLPLIPAANSFRISDLFVAHVEYITIIHRSGGG